MDGRQEGGMGDRQQPVDAFPVAVFENTGMLVQGKYCVCLSPQLFFFSSSQVSSMCYSSQTLLFPYHQQQETHIVRR